jgi:hypothetical protein
MSSEISDVLSSRALWDHVAEFGLAVVILGTLFQSIVHFETLTKWGSRIATLCGIPAGRGWKRRIGRAGALLLIAGLAVEYLGTSRSHDLTQQITAQLFDRATTAELELAKMQPRRLNPEQQKSLTALFASPDFSYYPELGVIVQFYESHQILGAHAR